MIPRVMENGGQENRDGNRRTGDSDRLPGTMQGSDRELSPDGCSPGRFSSGRAKHANGIPIARVGFDLDATQVGEDAVPVAVVQGYLVVDVIDA
jgi:hypothetical protein